MHISKDAKWEILGEDWRENQSMIEILTQNIPKPIYSLGIKPLKGLRKTTRKKVQQKGVDYYFVPLNNNPPDFATFHKEHDAVLFCRKIKGIKQYRID